MAETEHHIQANRGHELFCFSATGLSRHCKHKCNLRPINELE